MSKGILSGHDWAVKEFSAACLGDERRTKRLVKVAETVAASPGKTLPEAMGGWAALKAAYRLFDGEDATHQRITAPHRERTLAACRAGGEHFIVEDTTSLSYASHEAAKGLGPISAGDAKGIMLHTTLALRVERWTSRGEPEVSIEGFIGQRPWVRKGPKKKGRETKAQRLARSRESERWAKVFDETGGPPEGCRWTYIADREGDIFRVMWDCRQGDVDFIIRAMHPRRLVGAEGSPFDAVASSPVLGRFTVAVRARPGVPARTAMMELRAVRVTLRPPKHGGAAFEPLEVNVVEAREVDAPEGVEPIHWVLLTSWPVETFEEALRVVRGYEKRWLIEEYHKALKTGAGMEKSELQTRGRLEALLGILAVAAARLVNMKLLARSQPAERVPRGSLGGEVFDILKARFGEPAEGWTNRDVLVGIARLGGFLARKSDGDPGWITIWRGWRNLMLMIQGLEILQE